MAIRLSASRLFAWHLIAILLFGMLNLVVLMGDGAGHHGMMGFSPLFRLSGEGNAPSIFSALALVAAALAAARNAQSDALRDGEGIGWRIFAIVLFVMAIDEAIQLHEILSSIGTWLHGVSTWLSFIMYPYALVALALAVFLFRFWARQSGRVRIGIALGGICYLAAAVGLEIVENRLLAAGASIYERSVATAIAPEELGEMLAVALILRAFLARFAELGGGHFVSLVGARPIVAIAFPPASQLDQPREPITIEREA